MKFTSEDLLKAMGLKDGNYITFEDDTRLFEVVQEEKELYLVCDFKKFNFFNKTLNKNFVIIQPKPTLTEDEKVILRNLPNNSRENKVIGRKMNDDGHGGLRENLWIYQGDIIYDFNLFRHLFKSIEIGEEFIIKELLK